MRTEISEMLHDHRIGISHSPSFSRIGTRLGAIIALCATATVLGYILFAAYRAFTDAYVAPIILSPDNDLVLDYRQKVMELQVQRGVASAQLESVNADLDATEAAETRLNNLYQVASGSLSYTSNLNKSQVGESNEELQKLDEQHGLMEEMHRRQDEITKRAQENFDAGLVTRSDYEKEVQTLRQNEVALLENSRARAGVEEKMDEALLGRSSLNRQSGAMPEVLQRETQMVQVTLELLRIQAETRAKQAEQKVLKEQITHIDGLQKELESRPIYRAIEKSTYAAFVPYTQMDTVQANAGVYECSLGFFLCRPVGRVAEVVPGEVSATDPWGAPARGQYILLDLKNTKAAKDKVLRVRRTSRSVS